MQLLPLGLTGLLLATDSFLLVMTDMNGSLTATSIVFINDYVYSQTYNGIRSCNESKSDIHCTDNSIHDEFI
jgi:hypothetical protein